MRIALIGIHIPVIYNPHGWAFNIVQSKKKELAYKLIERVQIPFTKKCLYFRSRDAVGGAKTCLFKG